MARPACAGPTLDEALARHRALLVLDGASAPGLTPITLSVDAGDSVTAAIGGPGAEVPSFVLPPLRGDGGIQLRTGTMLADGRIEARFGVAWWAGDRYPLSLDESSISVGLGAGRLYASVERRQWGPSWTGSLILDGGARPVPAIGWRKDDESAFRSPLLSWLGPWRLDAFAGQLAQRTGPHDPHLLGARIQAMPLPGLELAVSATLQWGGGGRPEIAELIVARDRRPEQRRSFPSLGRRSRQRPGRIRCPLHPCLRRRRERRRSMARRSAKTKPATCRATIWRWSAPTPRSRSNAAAVRLFAERANTTMSGAFGTPLLGGAYRHHIYTDGYTQQGEPLGQPAGGDVRLNSIGVLVDAGAWTGTLMLHHGDAYPTAQLYPGGGRIDGVNGEVAWQVDPRSRLGLVLAHWREPSGFGDRTRAQLWWRVALR